MCPGKDSFALARKPPLFLGSGARPTLSSWHGVSPACDGCRASWHLRIPQGRWLVLSRVPLPALGWHVLVKSKHLHSARGSVGCVHWAQHWVYSMCFGVCSGHMQTVCMWRSRMCLCLHRHIPRSHSEQGACAGRPKGSECTAVLARGGGMRIWRLRDVWCWCSFCLEAFSLLIDLIKI